MGFILSRRMNRIVDASSLDDNDKIIEMKCKKSISFGSRLTRVKSVAEDWLYLALLGTIMALFSLLIDNGIDRLNELHLLAYEWAETLDSAKIIATFCVWTVFTVALVVASTLFTHYAAPQAIGSGIPEMKTILRGVVLKEYLTFRTLISKVVGLTLALGSGIPVGKEGPFVHIASVVASQLSRLVHGFSGIYENESRSSEMLAAGCAVGVACTFSAPIGGVLFSIEVTSVFFAVRNYWRGFFAAACSATLLRILQTLVKDPETMKMNAFYQTHFPPGTAFVPHELAVFALIGFACGIAGALFILLHRKVVLFLRHNPFAKMYLQRYWLIYPILVTLLLSSITYPEGLGQFMAGKQKFSKTVMDLFVNCTWTAPSGAFDACPQNFTRHWTGHNGDYSVFASLSSFFCVYFVLSVLCGTLPIPSGVFMPVFILGATFGRAVGEVMATLFPHGITEHSNVYPGVYAVVGAAALAGAVTHTVSVAVIIFEVTGQLLYLLPVMIAVMLANAVCSHFQPSIYDSIIRIKHLPYLPDIRHSTSIFHQTTIDKVMLGAVAFVSRDFTYGDVQELLLRMPHVRAFPVVSGRDSMLLVGSIGRSVLMRILDEQVGLAARQVEAASRVRSAIARASDSTTAKTRSSYASSPSKNRARNRFTIVPVSSDEDESGGEEEPREKNPWSSFAAQQLASSRPRAKTDLPFPSHPSLPTLQTIEHFYSANNSSVNTVQSAIGEAAGLIECSSLIMQYQARPKQLNSFNWSKLIAKLKDRKMDESIISGIFRTLSRISFHRRRGEEESKEFDLYGEEREEWEAIRLAASVDFTAVNVDQAPFQLVAHTSLFKAHSLFSLLGLSRAYITRSGMLVGVVGVKELRIALERAQDGELDHLHEEESTATAESGKMEKADAASIHSRRDSGLSVKYNEDSSDYEDNLQPKLEVVSRTTSILDVEGAREDDEPVDPAIASGRRESERLRRLEARRESLFMEEMTTTRRPAKIQSESSKERESDEKRDQNARKNARKNPSNSSPSILLTFTPVSDDEDSVPGELDAVKLEDKRRERETKEKNSKKECTGESDGSPLSPIGSSSSLSSSDGTRSPDGILVNLPRALSDRRGPTRQSRHVKIVIPSDEDTTREKDCEDKRKPS